MPSEPDLIPSRQGITRKPVPVVAILLAVILIGSFFIRAYRPLSRSQLWPNRARSFYSAIHGQRWDSTYQSRHPGVTTMAIGAFTYFIFDQVEGTPLEGAFTWGAPPWASTFGVDVAIGMVGLSLVIVLLLLAITLVLRKLGGWALGLCALVLVSFSPFYLTQSRVFHVDALASTLMLLSALLLILHLEKKSWVHLVVSGLVGGLALLTKTPSVFLIPFSGLALLVYAGAQVYLHWSETEPRARIRWIAGIMLRQIIAPLLIWLLFALIVIPLWPALWEEPIAVLDKVFTGATEHVENAHINERFFAGHIYINQPPPATYYPTSLLYRTTFISLFFIVLSLLVMTVWRKRRLSPVSAPTYWLLVAYIVFFTIQMTISAKQIDRYILPTQVMLDVIAAVGLVSAAKLVKESLTTRLGSGLEGLGVPTLAIPLILHLLVTLPFFPDFGAHYNYLLGGNQGANAVFSFQGQNEGVFDVVKYMLDHPGIAVADEVGSDSIWKQFDLGDGSAGAPTHELVSVVDVKRRRIDIDRLVDSYANQTPELIVSFDNVIYLWLYPLSETPDVSTIHIKRGWAGFSVVAWVVTLAFAGVIVGALRYSAPARDQQLESSVN